MTAPTEAIARLEALATEPVGDYAILNERPSTSATFADLRTLLAELAEARKVIAEATAALRPFAEDGNGIHPDWADNRRRATLSNNHPLTVAHFRRASEFIRRVEGK